MRRTFTLITALVLVLAAVFLCPRHAGASISNLVGQLGTYSSSCSQYGVEVDKDNNIHYNCVSTTTFDSGSKVNLTGTVNYGGISSNTTSQTLTASQSGQTIIFYGTQGDTVYTLPTCNSVGLDIDVVAGVAKYFVLKPAATDTIVFAALAKGASVSNSATAAVGDEMELQCAWTGGWIVKNMTGTWAAGS